MRYLTILLTSVLSLFGYQERPGITSVTRVVAPGTTEAVFSRTTYADGVATFQCVDSGSGRCFYRVFAETCQPPATATEPALHCSRRELENFALGPGQRRELRGLPADFGHCVVTQAGKQCRRD